MAEAAGTPGTLQALRWGLASAWASRRILLVVLAAHVLLAAGVLYPLWGPMDVSLGRHPDAAAVGRTLDVRWWTDLTTQHEALFEQGVNLLGAGAFVMVLAGAFFAGGLLESLKQGSRHGVGFEPLTGEPYRGAIPEWRHAAPGPASVQIFLRESARHFPRFLRLLVLSLPLHWLVQRLLNHYAVLGLAQILEGVEDERVGLILTVTRAVMFVATFQAVTVLFEYARAQEVLRPGSSLAELLSLPLQLLRARPGTLLGIEAGAFLLQLAAMLAFIPLDRLLGRSPAVAVTLGFAAMQAFLFLRLLIRAGAQGAQIHLVQSHLRRA